MITLDNKDQVILNGMRVARLENETIKMSRTYARHFYRVLCSWCINTELLDLQWKFLEIYDATEIKRYVISRDKIQTISKAINMFIAFGDERQLAIPLIVWDVYSGTISKLPTQIGIGVVDVRNLFGDRAWMIRNQEYGRWSERVKRYDEHSQMTLF